MFNGPVVARLVGLFDAKHDLARAQAISAGVLGVMAAHLAASGPSFLGQTPTIADIALYSYTAYAPEGHVPLAPYPRIQSWISRIEALPGFVPVQLSQPKFSGPAAG